MRKQVSIVVYITFMCLAGCGQDVSTTDEQTKESNHFSNSHTEEKKSPVEQNQEKADDENSKSTENPSAPAEDQHNEGFSSQEEIIASIKEQINDSLPPRLPRYLPLSSDEMKLSAAIDSNSNMYRVIFFESKKALPINSKELNNSDVAKPIAEIEVRQYDNEEEAEAKVGYINPDNTPKGNSIDLGHSIKGYPEGGAGNKWLNWHEGRWFLQVHASNIEGNSDYVPLAKSMVTYLEQNELPVPHKYGSVKADVEKKKADNNRISWQEKTIVYTISKVENPIDMLAIAAHFDNTEN